MLEATRCTKIYGQQQLGKCLRVTGSQPTQKEFRRKNYIRVKYFRSFPLYIYNEIKANYGTSYIKLTRSKCATYRTLNI